MISRKHHKWNNIRLYDSRRASRLMHLENSAIILRLGSRYCEPDLTRFQRVRARNSGLPNVSPEVTMKKNHIDVWTSNIYRGLVTGIVTELWKQRKKVREDGHARLCTWMIILVWLARGISFNIDGMVKPISQSFIWELVLASFHWIPLCLATYFILNLLQFRKFIFISHATFGIILILMLKQKNCMQPFHHALYLPNLWTRPQPDEILVLLLFLTLNKGL